MSELLEGLALRRAVAEMMGWMAVAIEPGEWKFWRSNDEYMWVYAPDEESAWEVVTKRKIPHYDTDLNTLPEAAALLTESHELKLLFYRDGSGYAIVEAIKDSAEHNDYVVYSHTIPATAAWNAVLAWKRAQGE